MKVKYRKISEVLKDLATEDQNLFLTIPREKRVEVALQVMLLERLEGIEDQLLLTSYTAPTEKQEEFGSQLLSAEYVVKDVVEIDGKLYMHNQSEND